MRHKFIRCGLVMIRRANMQMVKSWLPFVLEYFKYFGLEQELKMELIKLSYSMMGKIEYDFTKMAGICLWSFMFEANIVKFGENELEIFNSLFNCSDELVVETMITIFGPSVILKIENQVYRNIMIELVVDALNSDSIKLKSESLKFLFSVFKKLTGEQKTRILEICMKCKPNQEKDEFILENLPQIILKVTRDNSISYSKSNFFIDFIRRLKKCKEHYLRMQFIDCVVGIIEGGGIGICKMYFKKSILDLFKFKKKENQDPQEDNHLGDIDVLCHLIENFEKILKIFPMGELKTSRILQFVLETDNLNTISHFCKNLLKTEKIIFPENNLIHVHSINDHYLIMSLLKKIWKKGVEFNLQWRYELNLIHVFQKIHIENFMLPLLINSENLIGVIKEKFDMISTYAANFHQFFLKRIKKSNNEISKKLAELIVKNISVSLKELQKNEFMKNIECVLKSSSYSHRMKVVVIIEAGISYLSPSNFGHYFIKCLKILGNEKSETVARIFLKLKEKIVGISCLNQDVEHELLDLCSNFRIKFYNKEYFKAEISKFADFIREKGLDQKFIRKWKKTHFTRKRREEKIRKKIKMLMLQKNQENVMRRRSANSASKLRRRSRNSSKTTSLINKDKSKRRETSLQKMMFSSKNKRDNMKLIKRKKGSRFILKQLSKKKIFDNKIPAPIPAPAAPTQIFKKPPIQRRVLKGYNSSKRIPTPRRGSRNGDQEDRNNFNSVIDDQKFSKYSRKEKLKKIKTATDFSKIKPKVVTRRGRKVLRGRKSREFSLNGNEFQQGQKSNEFSNKKRGKSLKKNYENLKFGYNEELPISIQSSLKISKGKKRVMRSLSIKGDKEAETMNRIVLNYISYQHKLNRQSRTYNT